MKKLALGILFMSSFFCSQAQLTIGPEIGGNYTNLAQSGSLPLSFSNISVNNYTSAIQSLVAIGGYNSTYGFRAGLAVQYVFQSGFGIRSGAYFSSCGAATNAINLGSTIGLNVGKGSTSLNYIHIPITAVYRVDAGPGKFFFGAGPFFSYAIGGTVTTGTIQLDSTLTGGLSGSLPSLSSDQKYGSDSSSYKPLDYGLTLLGGYELPNGLQITAGYNYSMANLSNIPNYSLKNTCVYLSVAWMLSTDKKKKQ